MTSLFVGMFDADVVIYCPYCFHKKQLTLITDPVAAPEFFGCRGTARAAE